MNQLQTNMQKIKRLKLGNIVASFFVALILFFSTVNNSAIAASNKSNTTYPTNDNDVTGLLYSDSERADSLGNEFVDSSTRAKVLDPAQIPAVKQPMLDRSDPDAKLLEKTVKMFDEAGDFSAN